MTAGPLRRRLVGFMLLPAIAAVSPLIVLPLISREAGPGGWASAIAGESIGTFAAIVIGYGWPAIGPALISIASGIDERARLYRESLVVRLLLAAVSIPVLGVVCWLVANAILAMAVSETYGPKAVSDNAYLKVVLWSVASLALFRALGSSTFGIINCVEACVEGRVKFSMKAPKWMGGFGEKMGEKWRDGMSSVGGSKFGGSRKG